MSESIRSGPIAGIVGAGITGRAVARALFGAGWRIAVVDEARPGLAVDVARWVNGAALDRIHELESADVVVLCLPAPHTPTAERFVRHGTAVVSIADDLADVDDLVHLDTLAAGCGVAVVAGAGMSPGLSGLVARSLAAQVDSVEEIHIAAHGTGGPDCARQHHRALGRAGVAWHDGEWLERFGGSGRELCWFPEPIGARDCYRAELADPRLLQRAFPEAVRVTARVSANRRDRLTARLPMLVRPHVGGDIGAVRVEVRGADAAGGRVTVVSGAAGRVAELAAWVAAAAAVTAHHGGFPSGVNVLGQATLDNAQILAGAQRFGVRLQEFTGVARASQW